MIKALKLTDEQWDAIKSLEDAENYIIELIVIGVRNKQWENVKLVCDSHFIKETSQQLYHEALTRRLGGIFGA